MSKDTFTNGDEKKEDMKEIEERGRRWRENICERKKKTRRNELEYVGYQVDIFIYF